MAVKKTAELFKQRLLEYASFMLNVPADTLDVCEDRIERIADGEPVLTLEALATEAFYSLTNSRHITAETTYHCKDNTFAFGACFVEIEVDVPVGKIKIVDIVNVHDSGVLINPKLAEAQVHGGMSMGLGYALSEQLRYDDRARPLNDNLLDYKLPTSLDTPELTALFVETNDPTAPYGNKALGEPPAIPVAAAVRNALLHATGVAVGSIPLSPQKLVEHFTVAGLIS
ncbi:MAG: molybdopterin cofactor-binding domain-containing protein, partial [Eubacteriales bacterium]|nr:molybdopterin cofactor-binding domain-containing protein [Eubacteriales bacterium]